MAMHARCCVHGELVGRAMQSWPVPHCALVVQLLHSKSDVLFVHAVMLSTDVRQSQVTPHAASLPAWQAPQPPLLQAWPGSQHVLPHRTLAVHRQLAVPGGRSGFGAQTAPAGQQVSPVQLARQQSPEKQPEPSEPPRLQKTCPALQPHAPFTQGTPAWQQALPQRTWGGLHVFFFFLRLRDSAGTTPSAAAAPSRAKSACRRPVRRGNWRVQRSKVVGSMERSPDVR